MSLRIVHVFLITAGALLTFGAGFWGLSQNREAAFPWLAFSAVSLLLGAATVGYGIWFVRRKFTQLQ